MKKNVTKVTDKGIFIHTFFILFLLPVILSQSFLILPQSDYVTPADAILKTDE